MATTFIHNCEIDEAPNPSCCTNPGVLCEKCARLALNRRNQSGGSHRRRRHQSTIDNNDDDDDDALTLNDATKPEPLGVPHLRFGRAAKAEAQLVTNTGKREPLGIPHMRFGKRQD